MARFIYRFIVPLGLAAWLQLALPVTALASAPWIAGCSGQPSSTRLCIYIDWHWEGTIAQMSGDNASYDGETWPSSTYGVNNSISSNKNLYSTLDILWYEGYLAGQWQCLNSNTGYYYVGLEFNDHFSSHDVVGAC